ncbi:MAG: transposase [Halanaerobium sp.]|nr:MAG: transposase [Halanaerobium sp.]
MPSSAQVNKEIKQLYINGHFCYVYKAGIVTNGLGVIRHISFFDDEFKDNHPEIPVEKKSDSPDEDKSIGDSTSLKPVLEDYFNLHNHHYSTFIADSAFDSYQTYPFLIKDFGFDKAVIPLNSRNSSSDLPQPDYNENGWPLCPKDSSLPMKPNGWCRGKNRSPRFKFVCPKTNHKGGKRNCYCEDPCTDSSYGRVTYTYPDQDLRTYPGIIRDTDDWIDLYKKRGVVEQTINYFKDAMVTGNLKTQNLKSIKADVFLAGITQLLTLILADKMDKPENIRSLRSLIA